jgi:hypothetical protein
MAIRSEEALAMKEAPLQPKWLLSGTIQPEDWKIALTVRAFLMEEAMTKADNLINQCVYWESIERQEK